MSRKGGKQRNSTQIEKDRLKIANLYLKGYSQSEIGKRVNLHQSQISKELAAIRERWKQKTNIDFDEKQAIELERLDLLEKKYIDAFERSKNKKEIISRKKVPMIKIGNEWKTVKRNEKNINPKDIINITIEETIRIENPDGNVRYLDGIAKCINLRTRIMGLQKGLLSNQKENNEKNKEINNAQRLELLTELLQKGEFDIH